MRLMILAVIFPIFGACSPETASLPLRWEAPTENDDGSELDNLAGYRLYWWQDGEAVNQRDFGPHTTSFELRNLTDGEWFVGISAINSDGEESDLRITSINIDGGEVQTLESTVEPTERVVRAADPEV